jgi:hypothetical protein
MTIPTAPTISRRQKTVGPDHHLWNNHGHWWFHGTVHLPDGTGVRKRVNLKTHCESTACQKRDHLIQRLSQQRLQP